MFANVFQPRFCQFRCGPLLREVVCRIAHAPAFMSIFLFLFGLLRVSSYLISASLILAGYPFTVFRSASTC